MARIMKTLAAVFTIAFSACLVWQLLAPSAVVLALCITFGVTAYHFAVRLLVGGIVDGIFHNEMDWKKAWFQPRKFEKKLYEILRVKRWTKRVPTYAPKSFSLADHSWEELVMATCQAEIVHEIIIAVSFLPILMIIWFGEPFVFSLTSVIAAAIDGYFVVVQRYNRPRFITALKREEKRRENSER